MVDAFYMNTGSLLHTILELLLEFHHIPDTDIIETKGNHAVQQAAEVCERAGLLKWLGADKYKLPDAEIRSRDKISMQS